MANTTIKITLESKVKVKSVLKKESKVTVKSVLKKESKVTVKPVLKKESKVTVKPVLKKESKVTVKPVLKKKIPLIKNGERKDKRYNKPQVLKLNGTRDKRYKLSK